MNLTLEFTHAGQTRTLVKHPRVVMQLGRGEITEAQARQQPWYLRATIAGRKRKFTLVTSDKQAIADARSLLNGNHAQPENFKAFIAAQDAKRGVTIGSLAEDWVAAGLPFSASKPRTPSAGAELKEMLTRALRWWSDKPAAAVTPKLMEQFAVWRRAHTRNGCRGDRAIDKELASLSCLCQWALLDERIKANPFATRETFQNDDEVTHCHEAMPETDEQVHRILTWHWSDPEDVVRVIAGASLAFMNLTGLRPGEPKFLRRLDPAKEFPTNLKTALPGLIYPLPDGSRKMKVLRTKHGQNPAIVLRPVLTDFLASYTLWLDHYSPKAEQLFPVAQESVGDRLDRACKQLQLPPMKPHGFGRAYYVRVRRSQGTDDAQIAVELGQSSNGELIRSVYGDPGDGVGGNLYDWLPKQGPAAWQLLRDAIPTNVAAINF